MLVVITWGIGGLFIKLGRFPGTTFAFYRLSFAAGAGEVFAVVHPRSVALHRQVPEGSPRNVWEATAERVDLEGDRVRVVLGGVVPLVAEVTRASADELRLAEGGPVWATVKATEVTAYPA